VKQRRTSLKPEWPTPRILPVRITHLLGDLNSTLCMISGVLGNMTFDASLSVLFIAFRNLTFRFADRSDATCKSLAELSWCPEAAAARGWMYCGQLNDR
jgi:hypothetical protein